MPRRRRGPATTLDAWPGYVDALSTLLMVITFVLLVFVLAQAFLSVKLSARDTELAQLDRQIAQLSDMLSLEKGRDSDLTLAVAGLNKQVQSAEAERDALRTQLAGAQAQLQSDQAAAAASRAAQATLQAQLADAATDQKSAAARMQILQAQAQTASAMQDKVTSDDAQIALLNKQLAQLRLQLTAISADLDLANSTNTTKTAQIKDLTQKLNLALANKVEELQRYRSEFFGKLRDVLKNVHGVQIVGDRFVFQSEVLFPVDGATLSDPGKAQLKKLAATLEQIIPQIPPDLNWILRVDGHADPQPIVTNGQYLSNWELSAERAINVVRFLIAQGVPQNHLAATAFGDTQPLAPGHTAADYARDRRIELRLTDR
jgi:chemotaxis protein MotB